MIDSEWSSFKFGDGHNHSQEREANDARLQHAKWNEWIESCHFAFDLELYDRTHEKIATNSGGEIRKHSKHLYFLIQRTYERPEFIERRSM